MTYKENNIKEFLQTKMLLIYSKMSRCHATDVIQKTYGQGWRKDVGSAENQIKKLQSYFLCMININPGTTDLILHCPESSE